MEYADNAMILGAEYLQKQRGRAERIHADRLSFWVEKILPYMSQEFFSNLIMPKDPSVNLFSDGNSKGPIQFRKFLFENEPVAVNFAFKTSPYSVERDSAFSVCVDVTLNSVMHKVLALDLSPHQCYKIHETVFQLGWTLLVNEDRSIFRFIQTSLLNAIGYASKQERDWLIEGFAPWPFYV
jgi:hypothetical protein